MTGTSASDAFVSMAILKLSGSSWIPVNPMGDGGLASAHVPQNKMVSLSASWRQTSSLGSASYAVGARVYQGSVIMVTGGPCVVRVVETSP